MYRFNYFTEKANHVINLAITSAEELGHNYIGSEHLLLGILKEDAGLGAQALRESGVQTEDVEKLIKENIGVGEPTRPRTILRLDLSVCWSWHSRLPAV